MAISQSIGLLRHSLAFYSYPTVESLESDSIPAPHGADNPDPQTDHPGLHPQPHLHPEAHLQLGHQPDADPQHPRTYSKESYSCNVSTGHLANSTGTQKRDDKTPVGSGKNDGETDVETDGMNDVENVETDGMNAEKNGVET
ncbi:OLC1v1016362C1 [Oldenlandia corymbosa var. corymbosa]|uniref:OLC1v1016362C1 n=1 Tax=Oldenlandia corymbosa var. corymbosa TaxID=529605 RepID=A0AAV1E7E2_OLDCO|nr:OLC1v1016362C1 [Oldenlandia corymbosa var. corymbosa]